MSDIKAGDKVRVVIEDTVDWVDFDGRIYLANAHDENNESWFREDEPTVVSVEKVEPPAEVFGPGDVVRPKGAKYHIALGQGGFLNLITGNFHEYGAYDATVYPDGRYQTAEGFNSDGYEKVNLVEAPF